MSLDAAGTLQVAGRTVPRFGYGTMRLTGPRISGPPADRDEALRVLRRAVELGVRVLDTAWYYGPDVADELVAEALRPYPDDLVVVSKLGAARREDGSWSTALRPEELRAGAERELRLLRLETLPVVHLRWTPNPDVTFAEALDAMLDISDDGLLERVGLSNVDAAQLELALGRTPVATVSNPYSVLDRSGEDVLRICEREGIPFLPFFPLGASPVRSGSGVAADARVGELAGRAGAGRTQLALAWLLHRSPVLLPIPGTGSVAHLEENLAAADLRLTGDVLAGLDALAAA
ncbi:aldo/keto reductase [Kineococcus glutinatus]|uniref:Oxidoreductase n=1 Tax=Kineococcus glutinatus TaxID=1070872 RepID=A0ABP9H987_9ACTN